MGSLSSFRMSLVALLRVYCLFSVRSRRKKNCSDRRLTTMIMATKRTMDMVNFLVFMLHSVYSFMFLLARDTSERNNPRKIREKK